MLFNIEYDFYSSLTCNCDIDPKKIFVVKNIGDEIWFLYEIENHESRNVNRIAKAFIEAALTINSRHCSICVTERQLTHEEKMKWGLDVEIKHFTLPIKILIDMIDKYFPVSEKRYEYFKHKNSCFIREEKRFL